MRNWVGAGMAPPKSLNIFSKVGVTNMSSDDGHGHGHDEHDGRVDHRALHAPLQLLVLLDVRAEPLEDGVEDAADLAGADELDESSSKTFGWLRQRVGEGRARPPPGASRP